MRAFQFPHFLELNPGLTLGRFREGIRHQLHVARHKETPEVEQRRVSGGLMWCCG